jgi:hypothetical protein
MLRIEYRARDGRAVLAWNEDDERSLWVPPIKRVVVDQSVDAAQEEATTFSLPWWNFAGARDQFLQVFVAHGLAPGRGLEIGAAATRLLQESRRNADTYSTAKDAIPSEPETLKAELRARLFERPLSAQQLRNVGRIAALPAAATFSVPGAGKTTEALAWFFLQAEPGDRLLVVAPKNAFATWDEQLAECAPSLARPFARLRGGPPRIGPMLADDPRFMLITYQQLARARVTDMVAAHVAQHRCHVFLDESHRIKAGVSAASARAVLRLAHLPAGKLILSGTPMPQTFSDLVPQFRFLYPEVKAQPEDVVDLMRPIYVRTTKSELGLREVTRKLVALPMSPVQSKLYQLMHREVAREAAQVLDRQSRQAFRTLGRSVARLLQFVSNPSLLAAEIGFAHAGLLSGVLAEGEGPKLTYVLRRARQLARGGDKVLIWTSFVRNVEYLNARLADVGSVFIHGGVDAGDEDDDETREGKIKRFHDDPSIRVLVANPAAASEGVSLHKICHHAIYLDRTFNAAHYLQSEDRIHRFGLDPDQDTFVEIVECIGTVDETVRHRLGFKISQMMTALNDPALSPDPIPIDPADLEGEDEYVTGLARDDIRALATDQVGRPS